MDAKTIQRRDIIRGVREKWLVQYKHYPDDEAVGWGDHRPFKDVRNALRAIDLETASPADIDNALGGATGWGSLECDLCGTDVESLTRIGQEPDYDSRWVDVCDECLHKLSATVDGRQSGEK